MTDTTEKNTTSETLKAKPLAAAGATPENSGWKTVAPRRPPQNPIPGSLGNRLENVREEGEDGQDTVVVTAEKQRTPSLGAGSRTTSSTAPPVRKWLGGPVPSLGQGSNAYGPRSQSFSVGQHQDSFVENQMKAAVKSVIPEDLDPAVLASVDEELTEEEYAQMILQKLKSNRSKSSAVQNPPMIVGGTSGSPRRPSALDAAMSNVGSWRAGASRVVGISSGRSPVTAGPPPGLGLSSPRTPTGLSIPPGVLSPAELELRNQRRFSLAPNASFGAHPPTVAGNATTMRMFGGAMAHRGSTAGLPTDAYLALRRHSLAGPAPAPHTASTSAAYRHLSDALDHLKLDEFRQAQYGGLAEEAVDEYFDPEARRKSIADVGKGVPISQMPTTTPLFIVEFKAGRSDLFYAGDSVGAVIKKGDLVIVEADRGKDLGKVVNDNITPIQVQQLQLQQAELMPELLRNNKELHPKRIYRLAQPGEVAMLLTKSQDEIKALQICQTKVRQKKLPMEVVDAEYQWDRRKLTFYFVADRRIDFRELVRDLFKLYKTRIWMCAVNPAAATGAVPGVTKSTSPDPLSS